jgi:Asp-tRNA(Asn)/Glu-tRNA(Gln) amidotransferase A subunit family amidase
MRLFSREMQRGCFWGALPAFGWTHWRRAFVVFNAGPSTATRPAQGRRRGSMNICGYKAIPMTYARPISLLARVRAIATGETTAEREWAAFAARAQEAEPAVGAFVTAIWEEAGAAIPARRGRALGGLPVGIKDNFDTAFLPTRHGSSIYEDNRPARDAAIVTRLADAGAIMPVKTTTTEFAFLEPTATGNPWSLNRSPGGSSAGSAAAVAAGLLPAAIGSQTAGSIIRPASFCGVMGFKPTFDLLPTRGLKHFAPSLDTVGLFTAGVDDMRLLFAALVGGEARFERRDASDLRIAVLSTPWDDMAEAAAHAALGEATDRLGRAGAALTACHLPAAFILADAAHAAIQGYESVAALAAERRMHRLALSPCLAAYLDEAALIDEAAYRDAVAVTGRARRAEALMFDGVDALLTFASADVAPADRSSTGSPRFNRLWTSLGLPCVSVPGLMVGSLPIGIQLVGARHDDQRLLSVAASVACALQT